jgi:ligand-binding SRPBCC domain-containing protein
MTKIHLTTFIAAPMERVFDLCRSINMHRVSMMHTHEKVIGGVLNGLINENETVTWQGKHLYKLRQFTSKITEMRLPHFFADEMIKGDFKYFRHQHFFKPAENGTIMIDLVEFKSPYGIVGKLLSKFYLKDYIEQLLLKRNKVIKEYAETSRWKAILIN